MVLNAREADSVAHAYDLVRGLFDVLREIQSSKKNDISKQGQELRDHVENPSDGELKMIKNIEIAADIFRKASEKASKMGEREWKDTIEQ
tara:strand:- start:302 stop:571 length:270 start_codon:yes stop_codon:yes gene_type:complete